MVLPPGKVRTEGGRPLALKNLRSFSNSSSSLTFGMASPERYLLFGLGWIINLHTMSSNWRILSLRRYGELTGAIIAVVYLVLAAALTKPQPESWNDISRIAGIESLAERGTWVIDGSPWLDRTKDKILLDGRFYSDKMPLMTLAGAGVYALLHYGAGASLAPDCAATARFCAYPWLTWIFVAFPAALMVGLFYGYARHKSVPRAVALIGTVALGLGTMIFPFTLVFNHHVPAGACVFAAFYLLAARGAQGGRGVLALAGFLTALAISFDVLSGITAMVVVAIAAVRLRRRFGYFALGAAVPVLITLALDYQIAHTLIPPYMITSGYDYPGSEFPATFAGNASPDDYVAYAFRMFLGGKGLFAFNPLLLFALAGAVGVALKRDHPLRAEGAITLAGFVLLCLYLATNTGNQSGMGYGDRWYIVAIPILFSFAFFAPPLNATTWKNAAWIVFAPLLVISAISALQGAQAPWQDWLPPLQMTRSDRFPVLGFKWNLRLW